ncbi:MAG: HAD family hydrolase [Clostridiales bacterium]|nr:HAD family hydrolase [Clostridiales bacterium]
MANYSIEKPKLICLDLVDTLVYKRKERFTDLLIDQLGKFGINDLDREATTVLIRERYVEYSFGNCPNDEDYLRSIVYNYINDPQAQEVVRNLLPELFSFYEPVEGSLEFIEYCASKYKLVLASNFLLHWAETLLEKFGLSHYFEKLYISAEMGYRKPAREFYWEILKDYPHFRKSEILMIGDSVVNDYHGARDLGMSSILFNNGMLPPFYHQDIGLTFEEIKQII